jgi:hypothetical protein
VLRIFSHMYLYIFKNPVGGSNDAGYNKLNSKS